MRIFFYKTRMLVLAQAGISPRFFAKNAHSKKSAAKFTKRARFFTKCAIFHPHFQRNFKNLREFKKNMRFL